MAPQDKAQDKALRILRHSIRFLLIAGAALLAAASGAAAADPDFTCLVGASNGVPFCRYIGPVDQVYANGPSDLLLFYWDPAVWPQVLDGAESVGITGVSFQTAGAIRIGENPEFAAHFSSYALAAQLTGRQVTIQMRGVIGGYLKIDRIWLQD